MEDVFHADGQSAQLGAVHLRWFWYCARFVAIPVQGQASKLGGRKVDWIPFQYDRSLRGVAAAEDRRSGRPLPKGAVDGCLESVEGCCCLVFGLGVPRDGDIDNAARGNVWREENGGELDLVMVSDSVNGRGLPAPSRLALR